MTDSKIKENNLINTDYSAFDKKKIILILAIVGFTSFIFRLMYLPFDLPLTNDASAYFWYANDLSILGHFPSEISASSPRVIDQIPNNGWPSFLSLFFTILDSNNFLDYMNLQRFISTTISTLTIIPLYLLVTKFVNKNIGILASGMFVFSPRVIENSLLGNPESIFLFLVVSSLYFFLNEKSNSVIISFIIIGLASLVRYEGLLIIIPFSIMFFIRYGKRNNSIRNYTFALIILVLILLPMSLARIETTGQDGLVSHIASGPQYYGDMIEANPHEDILMNFLNKGFTFLAKYFTLLLIPMFLFFIPIGIIGFLKNRNSEKWTMIFFSFILLIPAFYAYSRGFEEMKYLYILYPILCICSGYSFNAIINKIKKPNLVFTILLFGIIGSSLFFTNLMIMDFEHEKEVYNIAKELSEEISTINRDYEGIRYFAWINSNLNNFPILSSTIVNEKDIKLIRIGNNSENSFSNLKEYFEFAEAQGMKHLVLDGNNLGNTELAHIFKNDNQYTFLTKIYDSKEQNYSYHVKAYEIDYERIDLKTVNKTND